jgi:hypothetical protein
MLDCNTWLSLSNVSSIQLVAVRGKISGEIPLTGNYLSEIGWVSLDNFCGDCERMDECVLASFIASHG